MAPEPVYSQHVPCFAVPLTNMSCWMCQIYTPGNKKPCARRVIPHEPFPGSLMWGENQSLLQTLSAVKACTKQ